MAYGPAGWWWKQQQWQPRDNWQDNSTLNYTQPIYYTTGSQVTVYPTVVVETPTEPEDDSPLAWLRREVGEMCELARAA